MRSVPQRLQRLVCAEHCRYYKPWATPEPDCNSAQWLLELVGGRAKLLDAVERLRGRRLSLTQVQEGTLLRQVCTPCQHYPHNCAYRRPDRSPGAEPCGGLLVLGQLLGAGLITPEDLLGSVAHPKHGTA
ncbi:MAG TPA: hypothetical protein VK997_14985 [Deferrisomatales bacterium]|nr:hypothetical protein [Deferrisomatales bacterium]